MATSDKQMKRMEHAQRSETSLAALTIVGSVFLVLIAWGISFVIFYKEISFKTLWEIHQLLPVLWVVDFFPLFTILVRRSQYVRNIAKINDLKNKLDTVRTLGERNAQFAQNIGNGKYDTDLAVEEDDILGKSLVLMRNNLLKNSKQEADQLWISQGKDAVSEILRLHNNIEDLSLDALIKIIKYVNLIQGAVYFYDEDTKKLRNMATYAYNRRKYINQEFSIGQGLIGQCAYEMDSIYRTEIPDDYATITSGLLGEKKPASIFIVPLIADEKLQGVFELASLEPEIPELTQTFLKELSEIIARTFFNLRVNKKTETLLQEAQQMTAELRQNEERLRQNAEEMRATQEALSESNKKLESKIREVQNAQSRLNSLLENASEVISIFDKNLRQNYESPSVKKIFGYTPEEVLIGSAKKFPKESAEAVNKMMHRLLQEPDVPISIEVQSTRIDGSEMIVGITGRNLVNDPAIQGIILNTVDRTERKRAEKEERLRSKMQSLSENSVDVIIRLSIDGVFFYANPIVEDYLKLPVSFLMNNSVSDVKMEEHLKEYFLNTIAAVRENPSQKPNNEIEVHVVENEQTTTRIMNFMAIPEINEGELETILFVGHDITEAKQIELEIQEKNKKIEDSINYAQRIQQAIVPDTEFIKSQLPQSFIFYRPRDVVSGDFPWYAYSEDKIYIAAVDCTGHGVPGALLSFVGHFTLNNIIERKKDYTAGEVCDLLHQGVRTTLKQDLEGANARDGMDIALCKIDLKNNVLEFAGAHRPLYLLRDGDVTEYKGNRKAIGGIPIGKKPEEPFTTYTINTQKGDKIFFFSDGLPDQVGGPEMKKYSAKRIREQIIANKDFSMQQFNDLFEEDFMQWKINYKQVDDVLLIGIEF